MQVSSCLGPVSVFITGISLNSDCPGPYPNPTAQYLGNIPGKLLNLSVLPHAKVTWLPSISCSLPHSWDHFPNKLPALFLISGAAPAKRRKTNCVTKVRSFSTVGRHAVHNKYPQSQAHAQPRTYQNICLIRNQLSPPAQKMMDLHPPRRRSCR